MSVLEVEAATDEAERRSAAPRRAYGLAIAGFVLPVVLAILWEWLVAADIANGRLMPPPSVVGRTLWNLAASGELLTHAGATLWRVGAGFGLGALAGTVLGAVTGALPVARSLLDPTLQALRAIPSIAWVPLFILWLGIFEASKVALIAVGVFFPVYLGIAGAILSVDRKLVEVGQVFRLSRLAMVRRVLLPAILPSWITSLRSGLGLGFMFVVAAIISFAVLGKLADTLLVAGTRPFLVWQDTARDKL